MTTTAVTALEVPTKTFVASLIERCPKTMMVRELMMNALEAARFAPEGRRLVEISPLEMDGTDKLAIWNTGPGMDAPELLKVSNIASSLGKEKSLSGNFGMGAKVASLPSNQRGMRYRSCKGGRVHEVILCKRDGVYGRLRRYHPDTGEYLEVVDVTDIAVAAGRTLNEDWTEVVLLGNETNQDTVRDPFNGDPDQDTQWLATYLYHRFYRLPDGVKVTLLKGTNKLDGNRQFEPIPARLRHFERHETVPLPSGIRFIISTTQLTIKRPAQGTTDRSAEQSHPQLVLARSSTKARCMMSTEGVPGPLTRRCSAFHSAQSIFRYTLNCRMSLRYCQMAIGNFSDTMRENSRMLRPAILRTSFAKIGHNGLSTLYTRSRRIADPAMTSAMNCKSC